MPIVNEHPGLALLEAAPFDFHIVGSRMVGKFGRMSDYDFLMVVTTDSPPAKSWLVDNGFKQSREGYGTDPRLITGDVWSRTWGTLWPSIDLIPVSPKEAQFRLQWFDAMLKTGDSKGGRFALAMKREVAWPTFWAVLAEFKEAKTDVEA